MKTEDAFEIGRILEFLGGITTAGLVAMEGRKLVSMDEWPNLRNNLPHNRYSVVSVVASVKQLATALESNNYSETLAEMGDLRESLKEMEEYLEMNPSSSSFLRNGFAEELVSHARRVKEKFREELASRA